LSTMATNSPQQTRLLIRSGQFTSPTSGICPGFIQANLVIIPHHVADDFEEFCRKNYQFCPLLERLPAGETQPKLTIKEGNDCDIRTDVPKYRVWKHGELVSEVENIIDLWRDDLVTFLFGCSFSFELALQRAGIEIRNITERKNVSMYRTNLPCNKVGVFSCAPIVSMRPLQPHQVELARRITAQFTRAHGAPVHCGDPSVIGIQDLSKVDFGDAVTVKEGEVPCFWACGVTSSMAAISAKCDITITHSPGHMFITDELEPTVEL
jgi:uncharacterized protein YcsI (UPF0317 family)